MEETKKFTKKKYEWVGDVDSYSEPTPNEHQKNIMNQIEIMILNIQLKMILKHFLIYRMVLHL